MDLDAKILGKLGIKAQNSENGEKIASNLAVEPLLETKAYKDTSANEELNTIDLGPLEGIKELQRQADQKRRLIEARNVANQRKSDKEVKGSVLLTQISKDVLAGKDIYNLFLEAVEVISLLTDNQTFYDQTKSDVTIIYGRGLKEAGAINVELEDTHKRILKLEKAIEQEEDQRTITRLNNAIKSHKELIEELENKLK